MMGLIYFGVGLCFIFLIFLGAETIAALVEEDYLAAMCCGMFGSVMSFLLAVLGVVMEVRL